MEKKNKGSKSSNNEELEIEDFINLGVILNDKDEVLMIRRVEEEVGRDGSVLTWAFPGGKQRFNESRSECVKREVLVETGYDIYSIREISLRYHPQFPVGIVYHFCRLVSQKPIAEPNEPHEIAEIRWVKSQEIRGLITTDLDPKVAQELGLR